MNSDIECAFLEKSPLLRVLYDHFQIHIVKNFYGKVVSEVQKDEQLRFIAKGDKVAAESHKECKFILLSKSATFIAKDPDAEDDKMILFGLELFKKQDCKKKSVQF